MKRNIIILIFFIFICNFLTLNAAANSGVPNNRDEMINSINNLMQTNLDNRASSFEITFSGSFIESYYSAVIENGNIKSISPNEPYFGIDVPFNNYIYKAGNDYNAICFKDGTSKGQGISVYVENNVLKTITLSYTAEWGETKAQTDDVENYARQTVNSLCSSSMSDYDKIKALHDFVATNFSFDMAAYSNNYPVYPYGMMTSKKGVCQSYSGLFLMLLKKAGFETRLIIKGENGGSPQSNPNNTGWSNHAWNMVKLYGKWYHIDMTWDDPITSSGRQKTDYTYFLKSTQYMWTEHRWDVSAYPQSLENYTSAGSVSSKPSASKPKASSATAVSAAASSPASAVSSEISNTSSTENESINSTSNEYGKSENSSNSNIFLGNIITVLQNNLSTAAAAVFIFLCVVTIAILLFKTLKNR